MVWFHFLGFSLSWFGFGFSVLVGGLLMVFSFVGLLLVWVCRIWYIIVVLGFCVFRLCCLLCGAVCVAIIPDLGFGGF